MAISIIKSDASDDDGLDLPGLAVRLVQLVGHQLHLPRHGEHALRHRARPQALVQLLLDTAEQRQYRNFFRQCCESGSESGSTCFCASRIRIRIH